MPAPEETVTVVDPRHPLFGRTLPCVGIANSSYRGRCCIVWIRPTVERHVPVSATNLAFHPQTHFPLPISVESLRQFLQEYLLATGGWKGDPSDDSTLTHSSGSATWRPADVSDSTHDGVDDAHTTAANNRSSRLRDHVSRVSAQEPGGKP
jgi:hypothetical protein